MAYDVFFLSFRELAADDNWSKVQQQAPHARRVPNIKGILAAHRVCAQRCRTSHFFVIDADNEIDSFDFSFRVQPGRDDYVHLWYAHNPVNDLAYGYGGLKLFPKRLLLDRDEMGLDLTMGFPLHIVPDVVSTTRFNTSAFDAWRSAFRECVKLVALADDEQRHERLTTWCEKGAERSYGKSCIAGARAGRAYADQHLGNRDALLKINDYDWLSKQFTAEAHEADLRNAT